MNEKRGLASAPDGLPEPDHSLQGWQTVPPRRKTALLSLPRIREESLSSAVPSPCRYQPGTLNQASQTEKLVELVEGEKVAVGGSDSGDEYALEMEDRPPGESFSAKLLFCPSGKNPTEISGTIVYATTAVICTSAHCEVTHALAVEPGISFVPSSLSGCDHRVVCHPGELPLGVVGRKRGRLGALRHLVPALRRLHRHHLEAAREQRSAHLQGKRRRLRPVDTNSIVLKAGT